VGFLKRVLERKKKEIRRDRGYVRELEKTIGDREGRRDFFKALLSPGTRVIAEIKKSSPSAGFIREVEPVRQGKLYELGGAAAISVLTDTTFFGGSLEDLRVVSEAVSLPVLRKDFIVDEVQILEAGAVGADAVLLIVRALSYEDLRRLVAFSMDVGLEPLVEVFTLEEAKIALEGGARVIGINNRDLDTLKTDLNLTRRLAPKIKELGVPCLVSESGIESKEHILELSRLGVDAFLVGTSIMRSDDPLGKLRELIYNS